MGNVIYACRVLHLLRLLYIVKCHPTVSRLFMEIIEKAPQSNEIVFLEDGSWRSVEQNGKLLFLYVKK